MRYSSKMNDFERNFANLERFLLKNDQKSVIFNLNFAAVKTHCARIAPAPLGGAAAWSYLKNARF